MKFSLSALSAALLLSAVRAECDEEDLFCVAEHKACTHAPDDCCDGFDCFGFNFFKTCQEPPLCLKEWYGCNPDNTVDAMGCCAGTVCAEVQNGLYECQKETISTRTVDLPGANLQEHVEEEPVVEINDKVSTCENKKEIKACLTGDPHITSFDKLTYDCQGIGEHIIYKAPGTRRQVQGRFVRVGDRSVSVTHGVAIQDEGGAEIPRVQVSIPAEEDSPSTIVKVDRYNKLWDCPLQLFVDNVQYDASEGFSNDEVTVTLFGVNTEIKYLKSGMTVTVKMGYWNGCLMNTCVDTDVCEGDEDKVQGILGTPDGNPDNDWMNRDGTFTTIPDSVYDRKRTPAYEWVTKEWCLRERSESIFHYSEVGYNFGYYSRCDLEYGQSLVEFMDKVPQEIVDACEQELGCMMDALDGGIEAAIQERSAKITLVAECSPERGSCSNGFKCCGGLNCLDFGNEKMCSSKASLADFECMAEKADCSTTKCCGDMQCVEKNGGGKHCEVQGVCVTENFQCNNDCCDGLKCIGNEGFKTCKKLGECSTYGQMCNDDQKCCGGFECEDGRCKVDRPEGWGTTCWRKDWEEEKECEGKLQCLPFRKRKVCADPGGTCAAKYQWGCSNKFECCEGLVCAEPSQGAVKKAREVGLEIFDGMRQCLPDGQKEMREDFRAQGQTGGGWCKKGVFHTISKKCCAKSCGICGGKGCSKRPGGASKCCVGHIDRQCTDENDTVCKTGGKAPPEGAITDNKDKTWCANGVLDDDKCCPASCITCGGPGCSLRPGGSKCCTGSDYFKRTCKNKDDTACEIPTKTLSASDEDGDADNSDDDLEWCADGVLSDGGNGKACCPASCGTCGGMGCSRRPGGTKCCTSQAKKQVCKTKKDTVCTVP